MTTDMKQTGVPSVTRGRVQLTNPIQANNNGRVSQNPNQNVADAQVKAAYNPILAKGAEVEMPTPIQDPGVTTQLATNTQTIPTYQDLANGVSVDQFGRYLSELPEKDQMRFLENFANGVYKRSTEL